MSSIGDLGRYDPNLTWCKDLELSLQPVSPAVGVSSVDAHFFADWLSEIDRKFGNLDDRSGYRLMTDAAFETILKELNGLSQPLAAGSMSRMPAFYARGNQSRPPGRMNDWGSDFMIKASDNIQVVAKTAPNILGLFDFEGNAWEWMESLDHTNLRAPVVENQIARPRKLVGGGSYGTTNLNGQEGLKNSDRYFVGVRETLGFRLVIYVR